MAKGKPRRYNAPKRKSPRRSKARRRRSGGMTFPIAPLVGLAAGMTYPTGWSVIDHAKQGDWQQVLNRLSQSYLGFAPASGEFRPNELQYGLGPLIAGALVHKFIGGTLGVNRVLARAKIPLVRL